MVGPAQRCVWHRRSRRAATAYAEAGCPTGPAEAQDQWRAATGFLPATFRVGVPRAVRGRRYPGGTSQPSGIDLANPQARWTRYFTSPGIFPSYFSLGPAEARSSIV